MTIDISNHEGLVHSVAGRFRRIPGGDHDELLAAGRVGLWIAATRFDPARGFRFSTYAAFWIRQCIGRWLYQTRFLVKVPIHVQEALGRARRTGQDLDPACRAAVLAQVTTSLHDEEGQILHDVAVDDETLPAVCQREEHDVLRAAIEKLPKREAAVVRGLFLAGEPARAVGARLRISKATVAKVRRRALRRLRGLLEAA